MADEAISVGFVQQVADGILESFTGFSDDDGHLDDAALIAEHVLDDRCPGSWVVTGGGAGIKVSRTVAKLNEAFQVVGIGVAAIRAKPTARC